MQLFALKTKNFENFIEDNQNLSEASLYLKKYSYDLINKFADLDSKIQDFKNLDEPDEEMEELLQEWINHLVQNPPKKKSLASQVIKQYVRAVNSYLNYHRFRIDLKNLKFPQELKEEKYAITTDEIQQIFKVASWDKQAYYMCLISTGARPKEILGLTKDDVNWVGEKYKAIIPARLTKKGLSRTVFFSKECNAYLNQIMKREGNDLFYHHENLKQAVTNEGTVFRSYCKKIGLDQKYETTGFGKINLYCFRAFFFTKALDHFKDDIAHAMTGHGAYLQVYQRRTEQQKKELWDELEPEVLVFDQSKKEQRIRDLEIALKQNAEQGEKIEMQQDEIDRLTNAVDYLMEKEKNKQINL